jgi:diphosphomevalonate decarboxylase
MSTAHACSNIALVKYWGKRDSLLNLPAAGSLSLTLAELVTTTTVTFDADLAEDELILGGAAETGEALRRTSRFLDLVRPEGKRARVISDNSFPTASGLASSASAFAAMALAAVDAAGLSRTPAELSALARRGSGSAARSIFGGFVEMQASGDDPHALPLEGGPDVSLVVAVVGGGVVKAVSSRSGMEHTSATSPLYPAWLGTVAPDLAEARTAVARRDLEKLGEIAEQSALTMHASALAARPGVVYWRGATLEALHEVRALRHSGIPVWGTIDAGPHLKALTTPDNAPLVAAALSAIPGVTRTIVCSPGSAAKIVGA